MLGRRLLALLVAVLCIAVRVGVQAGGAHADEIKALGGPALVYRMSSDVVAAIEEPAAPDESSDPPPSWSSLAVVALHGRVWVSSGAAPASERSGDPRASRGPPSLVVA